MGRKSLFDNFDEYADDYRSIHNKNIEFIGATSEDFSEYKVREVVQFLDRSIKVNILDLGCGDGATELFFRKYLPNSRITGLDVSEASIRVAKGRHLTDCTFRSYNGVNIPYTSATFDIVFIACVLHHVDASRHAILVKECRRVLKAGGQIFMFEHNPWNPVTRKVVRLCPFDNNAILLRPGYAKGLFKLAGFAGIQTRYTLFFPRKSVLKGLVPVERYLWWLPLGGQYYVKSIK